MLVNISKFEGNNIIETTDEVIDEKNLKIYINDKFLVNLKCSSGYEKELAIGFCISEGILEKEDIKDVKFINSGNFNFKSVYIYTDNKNYEFKFNFYLLNKSGYIPKKIIKKESCDTTNHDIIIKEISVNSDLKISREEIFNGIKKLNENANLWKKTGGTHISGLLHEQNFLFVEDISRHITLDKLIGIGISKNLNFANSCFFTSGRISSDFISKIVRINVPIMVTKASVTDKAIEIAKSCNITLIGFVRNNKFNVYSHKERIIL